MTALLEANQLIIIWVPGHSGIQQNKTADTLLVGEGAGIRLIGPEPYLLLSLIRFKFKIRNWIGKRKEMERRVCERYRTSQLFWEGPTIGTFNS